jgi:membrane protease YdiL (CAAX protease family)
MNTRVPTFGNPAPWGYFTTVAWAVFAFVVSNVAAIAYSYWIFGLDQLRAMIEAGDDLNAKFDGVLIANITILSAIVQIVIIAFAIRIRRWSFPDYLGLTLPPRHVIVQTLVLLVALLVVMEGVTLAFGYNTVPPFQVISYRTAKEAGGLIPLFAAVVLFAPVAEEVVFRGFLYRGFVRKPGHEPYVILIITLVWMAVHQQYDWVGLLQIFVIGLLLGWVRWSTGSIGLTILMHMAANLFASVETIVWVEWLMD